MTFSGFDPADAQMLGLSAALGAKLGAIRRGLLWTGVDVCGIGSLSFRAVWTAVDVHGWRLEIYGSEGCGFKSCRARHVDSLGDGRFSYHPASNAFSAKLRLQPFCNPISWRV